MDFYFLQKLKTKMMYFQEPKTFKPKLYIINNSKP